MISRRDKIVKKIPAYAGMTINVLNDEHSITIRIEFILF